MCDYYSVDRSTISPRQLQPCHTFTVVSLNNLPVNILSVFNDELLISSYKFSHLFIYNREGRQLLAIAINGSLLDAAWTPRGVNIVYTASYNRVVVMSKSGKLIVAHPQFTSPQRLSVFNDSTIYLIDGNIGVYQSVDDGISWSFAFQLTGEWRCSQLIKVTIDQIDYFWTLGLQNSSARLGLRVYNVDKKSFGRNIDWVNIIVSTTDGKPIDLAFSTLSYDGNNAILLHDLMQSSIYVLPLHVKLHNLLSPHKIKAQPWALAADKNRQQLYVGHSGKVGLYNLTLKNACS